MSTVVGPTTQPIPDGSAGGAGPVAALGIRAKAASRVLALASTAAKDAALAGRGRSARGPHRRDPRGQRRRRRPGRGRRRQPPRSSTGCASRRPHRGAWPAACARSRRCPTRSARSLDGWVRPNGLRIERVRVPLGVVAIIYENRPNVTSDAAGLCLKSGNAAFLRGLVGRHQLEHRHRRGAPRGASPRPGLPEDALVLVEDTSREAAVEFMRLRELDRLPDPTRRAVAHRARSSSTPPCPT